MKEFLSRAGRPFLVRNVDEDDDAYRDLVSLGVMTIPVTVVGERVVVGFDEAGLTRALGELPPPDR